MVHVYSIQIERGELYSAKAESQIRSLGFLGARRGNIFFQDKNGTRIQAASIKDMPIVYAVPKEIQDPEEAALKLAEVIPDSGFSALFDILAKQGDPYEVLVRRPGVDAVAFIDKLAIPGVYTGIEPRRFYPNGRMASHVMGYIGPTVDNDEARGRYGLELFYDDLMRGERGYFDEDNRIVAPRNGVNLITTIDYVLQRKVETLLKELIERHKARGGAVIVQDPKTGKILAMTGDPDFDPNRYFEHDVGTFLNRAVENLYEPGSIFKVITMAAALDAGKITPDTTYYDSGSVTFDGRTIKNWDLKAHGRQTMTQVLEGSLNTGAVFAQRALGEDLFYNYLIQFGLRDVTGIDLPGELAGNLNNLNSSRDINFATASFGQGISVTPIGLVNAISAIANKGALMKPYIVERIEENGQIKKETKPEVVRRVVREETAVTVTDMMVSAVKKNVIADIPNYEVAGKTGTAQVPNLREGGYFKDRVINTYVGFAPATNAKFVILVKLDEPYGAPLAGQTVVPAFRELAEFILNYYEIPPDSL